MRGTETVRLHRAGFQSQLPLSEVTYVVWGPVFSSCNWRDSGTSFKDSSKSDLHYDV